MKKNQTTNLDDHDDDEPLPEGEPRTMTTTKTTIPSLKELRDRETFLEGKPRATTTSPSLKAGGGETEKSPQPKTVVNKKRGMGGERRD